MWTFLLIGSIILLVVYSGRRSAVWGGATLGVIVGVIAAIVGEGFNWWTVGKGLAVGTFIGTICEWVGRLTQSTAQGSEDQ